MEHTLTFITGGARSGKSNFAEELVRQKPGKTVYIATAIPFDENMKDRIKKHREHRPSSWKTIEKYKNFKDLPNDPAFREADNVLFDCMTVMTTNQMVDRDKDWYDLPVEEANKVEKKIQADVKDLLEVLRTKDSVIVSNEVGLGIVPANNFACYYRDILGRINQQVAREADEVYFTVSGLPLKIK